MAGSATARQEAADTPQGARELSDWLIAHGQHWVTTAEVAELLGIPPAHVSPTLARWRQQGFLFSPTSGAYVPIPPEYRRWGSAPASHFIDPLMRHLGHDYYAALLSAAEVHGVAHQHPQVFQVMTSGRLRDRAFGRVRIEFVTSLATASRPTQPTNTPTGTMRVSTPEVTALDLVAHPRHSGGLSNVATVLGEMLEESLVDVSRLADVARGYPLAVAQRAGWLLDHVSHVINVSVDLAPMGEIAALRSTPTLLLPGGSRGDLDERWNVLVNTPVEPDL